MNKFVLLLIASSIVLSACGARTEGTGDDATAPIGFNANGEPTGSAVDESVPGLGAALGQEINVRVISSQPSLLTGGQEFAEISAAVTDGDNLPVADVEVAFSANGGVLQEADTVTNENGEATAVLSLRYDAANQDIWVRVVAENEEGSARIVAEGSTLVVTGEDNVVLGNDVAVDVVLSAGDGTALANEEVSVISSAGNTITTASAITNPQGLVSFVVGSAFGEDTLTFSALNADDGIPTVVEQYSFSVSDDQLQFAEDSPAEVSVNAPHEFSVNWSFNGAPIANEDIVFSVTAGQVVGPSTVTTDSAGNASVLVLSSIAGNVTLFAEASDRSVVNKHSFSFFGDTPAALTMSTTSSRVNTRDKATIVAVVKDANGNAVKDTSVIFSSSNLAGGQLSSTTGETNSDGEVEVTFTAGTTATEQDEITVAAEVIGTNINNVVSLTVVEPVLNVTLGSSNVAELVGERTQYAVTYVVQVADGGGQALADAQVQLSIEPIQYWKGWLSLVDEMGMTQSQAPDPDTWSPYVWSRHAHSTILCPGEDSNGNRILDVGEDNNGNGSLDPQDPAIIAAVVSDELATLENDGILRTDETGSGYFRVVFPVTNASWSHVTIVARAQALGVEATDSLKWRMRTDSSQQNPSNANPVNLFSPYGTDLDCSNDN